MLDGPAKPKAFTREATVTQQHEPKSNKSSVEGITEPRASGYHYSVTVLFYLILWCCFFVYLLF